MGIIVVTFVALGSGIGIVYSGFGVGLGVRMTGSAQGIACCVSLVMGSISLVVVTP